MTDTEQLIHWVYETSYQHVRDSLMFCEATDLLALLEEMHDEGFV